MVPMRAGRESQDSLFYVSSEHSVDPQNGKSQDVQISKVLTSGNILDNKNQ